MEEARWRWRCCRRGIGLIWREPLEVVDLLIHWLRCEMAYTGSELRSSIVLV